MEQANKDNQIDIAELRREVIDMRQLIPNAYKAALDKDFELFKSRLTSVTTQRNSPIQYAQSETPIVETSLLDDSALMRYNEDDLKQYIDNVEQFAMKLRKCGERKRNENKN